MAASRTVAAKICIDRRGRPGYGIRLSRIGGPFFTTEAKVHPPTRLAPGARTALTLGLAVYGLMILRDPAEFRLLDNVDLAIHEAGHVIFGPFGEFLGFLGGTLLQLIIPLTFFGYFLRQGNRYAASVLLWWVAQNCWNISVYVRDARAQELPLVGGGEHDWAYLLGTLGLLESDQAIGRAFVAAGVLCFTAAITWGLLNVRSRPAAEGSAGATGRT